MPVNKVTGGVGMQHFNDWASYRLKNLFQSYEYHLILDKHERQFSMKIVMLLIEQIINL